MELLVVTMAYTTPERESDALSRVRLVGETVRNAQGIITSYLYRGRGVEPCYAIFTTWESEEAWQQARERYSPRRLLIDTAHLFTSQPDQWYLTYLWGYYRPTAQQTLASMHLATIPQEKVEVVQRGWIEGLRRQAVHPLLAFGFLARGTGEHSLPLSLSGSEANAPTSNPLSHQTTLLLNLLSWGNETDRESFYADPDYKAVRRFLRSTGTLHILSLEPV